MNILNDLISQIKSAISQLDEKIKEYNSQYDLSDFVESYNKLSKLVEKLDVNKSKNDKCYELLSDIDNEYVKLDSFLTDKETISSLINSIDAVIVSCESDLKEGGYASLQSFKQKVNTVADWIKVNPLKSKTDLHEYSKKLKEIEKIRNEMDSQLDILDQQKRIINKLYIYNIYLFKW